MKRGIDPLACSLYSDHADILILHKWIEHADRIASSAYGSNQQIRQPAFGFQNLAAGLIADNPLEVADHHRIRMRPNRRA
ncbi:hypothetical protein D3C75_1122490 [compost metagenome]